MFKPSGPLTPLVRVAVTDVAKVPWELDGLSAAAFAASTDVIPLGGIGSAPLAGRRGPGSRRGCAE